MSNPISLFTNRGADVMVSSPAFSITKVLATAAPIVAVVVGLVSKVILNTDFTTEEVTALMIGLLGFLALTASADVLARSVATAASAASNVQVLQTPVSASLIQSGRDERIKVVATSVGPQQRYLCLRADGTLDWQSYTAVEL